MRKLQKQIKKIQSLCRGGVKHKGPIIQTSSPPVIENRIRNQTIKTSKHGKEHDEQPKKKGEREEAAQSDQCFPDNIFSNEELLKLLCYYVCIYRAVVMLKLCFMSI